MSKNLILFLLISFCSFSGGINEKSIEESLEEICDRISHCRSDEEEKKSSIQEILDNSLYEFNYKDGDVIGTKNRQARPGGGTIDYIIDARNRTSSTDVLKKDITETTIKTPGKLNIIHVDDGTPISWQYGVFV